MSVSTKSKNSKYPAKYYKMQKKRGEKVQKAPVIYRRCATGENHPDPGKEGPVGEKKGCEIRKKFPVPAVHAGGLASEKRIVDHPSRESKLC